ncbi:hypothetical protein KBZ18_11015 [Synechococcus sp. Cruz-9H2]|uniref:hypothetical protein n=1 Tax=unclassified Synechococcus TaxID=2626047 RepID=UPI0020CD755F|nr:MULTISPECIES: hypothetical protein [unclassified Synechococcus]MCP9820019.1 hypothetical protein [Synechococcus sp. Cruz-9H2]MCP9844325.1 hypothetical protein [Synechococcus sp. Edmonson 11F2]MCP9856449.1 hypothetical protein [Synechococcus sp. Cruz-9C9]MCP9863776.1 hypothetical protein [Synechococcus sp. Cruz-7E5]MCP9870929.1 hypothetical protein [Synechococcus sp. Cruz-7B9]
MAIRKPRSKARSAAKAKTKAKASSSDLAVPSNAAMERKLRAEQARWQAEEDLRTLRRAEEIRQQPQRLKQASRLADQEVRALQAIQRKVR